MWWKMFVCNMLLPVAMIVIGILMRYRYPKKINSLCGYRTARSMRNMDSWIFAHRYAGRLLWIVGVIVLPLSVAVQIPFFYSSDEVVELFGIVLVVVQLLALIIPIILTERALARKFPEEDAEK